MLKKKVIINSISKEDIDFVFKESFFWMKGANVWTALLIFKNDYINTELITSKLVKYDNWAFHYFIPYNETVDKNNLLLLNFFENPDLNDKTKCNFFLKKDLDLLFEYNKILFDINKIIYILINNIFWSKTNLNNHSLIWFLKSQQFIGDFLDLIISDLNVNDDLDHWNYTKFDLEKNQLFKQLDYKNYFFLYNNYLKNNKNSKKSEDFLKWEFTKLNDKIN